MKRLKQFTQEQSFIDHIDSVAFDQDELYDLLDEDTEKIYLCGDRFSIPLSKQGVCYIGINNPIAVIDSEVEVDWHEKKISVEDVTFDEKYQNIIKNAKVTNEENKRKSNSDKKKDVIEVREESKVIIGEYQEKSYLHSLISLDEEKDVLRLYDLTKAKLEKMEYDSDIDVQNKQKLLKDIKEKSKELITTRKKKGFYYSSYWLFSSNMCASMKDSIPCGRTLQLVYDYNKCNSYAKEIMDRAELVIVSPIVFLGDLLRTDKYFDQYKDIEKTKEIAKNFINYLKMPTNLKEGYRFILLALMILRVDMTDIEKKLSLICEFAKLLSITDKEFEDIIDIMNKIYENKKASYSFLSKRTSEVFGVVSDLYKTPTLKYGGIVRDSGFSQLFGIKML